MESASVGWTNGRAPVLYSRLVELFRIDTGKADVWRELAKSPPGDLKCVELCLSGLSQFEYEKAQALTAVQLDVRA